MRNCLCLLSITVLAGLLSGCSASCEGTWMADKSSDAKSPIAHASFCGDGTFTANAEYGGGTTRAMSGHYNYDGKKLNLEHEGSKRDYDAKVDGDTMTITHEGKTAKMNRMKPRKSGWF